MRPTGPIAVHNARFKLQGETNASSRTPCRSVSDYWYPVTLIRDSYFEQYARDLAEDIGAIPDDAQWPCTCIDWEQAARELQQDYTTIDFDGVDYWTR